MGKIPGDAHAVRRWRKEPAVRAAPSGRHRTDGLNCGSCITVRALGEHTATRCQTHRNHRGRNLDSPRMEVGTEAGSVHPARPLRPPALSVDISIELRSSF